MNEVRERLRVPDRDEYGPEPGQRQGEPLRWPTVERWLEQSRYYWLVTTRQNGRPHVVAIWGLWLNRCLYYNTSPETVTARNVERNPNAVAHPESAREVVIVEGVVERPEPSSLQHVVEAYAARFGWQMDPADPGMPFFVLKPTVVRAWLSSDIRNTASRWRFG